MNPAYYGVGVTVGMQCVGVHGCSPQPTDDELRRIDCIADAPMTNAQFVQIREMAVAVGWGDEGTQTYEAKVMNPTYSGMGVTVGMQCVGVHGCSPQPTDDELRRINCIADAPMTNAQSVQIRECTRPCFGLNLIEIFSK